MRKYCISPGRPFGMSGGRAIEVLADDLQAMVDEPTKAVALLRAIQGEAVPLAESVTIQWSPDYIGPKVAFQKALKQDGLTLEEWFQERLFAYLHPASAQGEKTNG